MGGTSAEVAAVQTIRAWRRSVQALALWAAAVPLIAGCEPTPKPPAEDPGRRGTNTPMPGTPPLRPGERLPQLNAQGWINGPAPTPDGPGVRLLVVDVWGMWCPMCAASAPGLVKLYEKYAGQGVAFVSLTNMGQPPIEAYVKRHSIPWPNGYGMTPGAIAVLGAASGIPGTPEQELAPTLYLVGPDGRVRWVDGRGRYRHVETEVWLRDLDTAIAAELAANPKNVP